MSRFPLNAGWVRLTDSDGAAVATTNPLPVTIAEGSVIERITYTDDAIAHGADFEVGPFTMDGYGKLTVLVLADQDGTFDVTQQLAEDSTTSTNLINDQATVADTLYTSDPLQIVQGWASVVWTNGHVSDPAAITVMVVKEGSVGSDEVVVYDGSGNEVFSDANPGSVQLRTAAGAVLGSAADPLPVGLTTAAGAAIGEAAAAPLMAELVNSSAAELFTTTTPGQVEALITDGAGTPVSQSVSLDYVTPTYWTTVDQAVTQGAEFVGTTRDCTYLPVLTALMQANRVSTTGGARLQESSEGTTWYNIPYTVGTTAVDTALQLANRGGHSSPMVRVAYKENNVGNAVLQARLCGSPN